MKGSEVQVRCPACRRLALKASPNEDGQLMGFLYYQCRNSRCKTKTEFVLYKNKSYILGKNILKKSFIKEISSSTDKLTKEFYLRILKSVSK